MDAPRQLNWSADQIARFWDYWSTRDDAQDTYFALQVGRGVATFAEHVCPLSGLRVLDFGSGPGHLISHLLSRGAHVSAADHSPDSIAEVDKRFRQQPGWCDARQIQGGGIPWEDNTFDAVFCLETIEHLHSHDCVQVFDEIQRVLRPGGHAIFTTPHREDLQKSHVYCPNCNSEFHRWQHLRSWTAAQLENQLTHQGYQVDFCEGLSFHDFQPRRPKPKLSSLRRWLRAELLQALDRWFPRAFPQQRQLQRLIRKSDRHHLAAVARKPAVAQSASHRAA